MFARITTFYTADPSPYGEPELIHRLRIRGQEVLRQMDGFEGLYVFMDRQSGKLISITLWESEEAMQRTEESVRPLRKEIGGGLATNIVDVGHYEVGEILEQERRERQIIEQELRVARSIQHASLPKEVPELEGWQIAPYYQPAREVGGDFYDFFELEDGRVGVVVGDATGKGMPAALMAEATSNMLRAVAQALGSSSPGEVLSRVNETLLARIPDNMFVTCLYAILNPRSGRLRYANAGQDLPYQRHKERPGDTSELRATGMPLGLMPGMAYEEKEAMLEAGDSILFYTDGLVEAHDPQREMFGIPRLQGFIGAHPGGALMIDFLLSELARFTGEEWEQEDDITLVTLQRSEAS